MFKPITDLILPCSFKHGVSAVVKWSTIILMDFCKFFTRRESSDLHNFNKFCVGNGADYARIRVRIGYE